MKASKDRRQRTWGVMMYHIGICDDDKNMCVVTSQGEKEFYGKLKDVLYKLPLHFIQIHKSFIVNQDCVIQYSHERRDKEMEEEWQKLKESLKSYKKISLEETDAQIRSAWEKEKAVSEYDSLYGNNKP